MMTDISVLPFSESGQFKGLFEQPHSAEGSWEWYQSLAETTLAPGEDAVFAVVFESKSARAALPLVRRGSLLRALTAPYTTLYVPALHDVRWARYLGAGAHSFVKGSLQLDSLDLTDPGMASFFDGLRISGLGLAQYLNFVNFYEPIQSFEGYWNARPSRLKTTVRRKLTQALEEGAEFCCYRNAFSEALAVYEDVYRASWKTPEPHRRFIETMVDKLAPSGLVRMGIMKLRGMPVAAQIWFICEHKATIFKLAHRENVKERSPGTLLTHWMISTLVREEALEEIDFGRGADAYKRDWLAQSRMRSGVIAANWKTIEGFRTTVGKVWPTRLSAFVHKCDHREHKEQ
jgi:hypothetical protein